MDAAELAASEFRQGADDYLCKFNMYRGKEL